MRHRLPTNRQGKIHTIELGPVTIELTVNKDDEGRVLELFSKCTDGYQGEVDGMCIPASLALQYGCPVSVMAEKLRWRACEPHGGPGQPKSISDGIAIVLEEYVKEIE